MRKLEPYDILTTGVVESMGGDIFTVYVLLEKYKNMWKHLEIEIWEGDYYRVVFNTEKEGRFAYNGYFRENCRALNKDTDRNYYRRIIKALLSSE